MKKATYLKTLFDSTLSIDLIYILLKVACLVNLKLAFMDWLFYNMIMLIKLRKMLHLNVDKYLLLYFVISEKPGYLSEKLKTLTSSNSRSKQNKKKSQTLFCRRRMVSNHTGVPQHAPKIILEVLLLCTLNTKIACLVLIFKLQH